MHVVIYKSLHMINISTEQNFTHLIESKTTTRIIYYAPHNNPAVNLFLRGIDNEYYVKLSTNGSVVNLFLSLVQAINPPASYN